MAYHRPGMSLPAHATTGSCGNLARLPEDAMRLSVDLAVGSLVDLLAIALVDRQLHGLAKNRLENELRWLEASPYPTSFCPGHLLAPQVARQFVELPSLPLRSPGVTGSQLEDDSSDVFRFFAEDEDILHCQACSTPVLKACDIVSSDYRVLSGRAYLTTSAYNTYTSEESYESQQYTIHNVHCATCELCLGITYGKSTNPQNKYKIGKFLLTQHLLVRLECCMYQAQAPPADPITPLCHR